MAAPAWPTKSAFVTVDDYPVQPGPEGIVLFQTAEVTQCQKQGILI